MTPSTFSIENETAYSTADLQALFDRAEQLATSNAAAIQASREFGNPVRLRDDRSQLNGKEVFVRVAYWRGSRSRVVRAKRSQEDLIAIEIAVPERALGDDPIERIGAVETQRLGSRAMIELTSAIHDLTYGWNVRHVKSRPPWARDAVVRLDPQQEAKPAVRFGKRLIEGLVQKAKYWKDRQARAESGYKTQLKKMEKVCDSAGFDLRVILDENGL